MNSTAIGNNIIKSQNLSQVVMPLVSVLATADLSWSDREKLSAAIQACYAQWDRMERERQVLNKQDAAGQQQGYYQVCGTGFPNK